MRFRRHYSGGVASFGRRLVFANACGRYRGPAIAWRVTACTAPDGSHWAVQSWQRTLPDGAGAGEHGWELRISHWRGADRGPHRLGGLGTGGGR